MKNLAITVPFHGTSLFVINHNGEPYTPMKPIVEGMGLDWKSQFTKIKQRFAKGVVEITIPSRGGNQAMVCLALRKLAGWLNTISPNKVNPDIRENVIRYQEECDDVLYEYWTKGEVTKKSKVRKSKTIHTLKLTDDELATQLWLLKCAGIMRYEIERIAPALRALDSSHAATFSTMASEYKRNLEDAKVILDRETRHLQTSRTEIAGWRLNSELCHLRQA